MGNTRKAQVPDREEFIRILGEIENVWRYDMGCRELARKHGIEFADPGASELAGLTVDLLARLFGVYSKNYGESCDDISYFCFELDFGREWEPGKVTDYDKNGNPVDVDMSSAGKLYDYLLQKGYE